MKLPEGITNLNHSIQSPEKVKAEFEAWLAEKRASGVAFAERQHLRQVADLLRLQVMFFSEDLEKNANLVKLLSFGADALEKLAEPPIETEGILRIEAGSNRDIRMLVQSAFANIDQENVQPYPISIFLLSESQYGPDSGRKLKIRTELFDLPHVVVPWTDLNKYELMRLFTSPDSEKKTSVIRILKALQQWEEQMSEQTGEQIGVLADGRVVIITPPPIHPE